MKQITFCLLLLFIQTFAVAQSEQKAIVFEQSKLNLQDIISFVESQTDIRFVYSEDRIPLNKNISLDSYSYIIQDLMKELSSHLALDYKIKNNNRILLLGEKKVNPTVAFEYITGLVIDELSGEPLFGATITNKQRSKGINSNEIGLFKYKASSDEDSLIISYIGFSTAKVAISDLRDESKKIQLRPSIEFDEVLIQTPITRKLETESSFNYYLNNKQLSEGFGFMGSDPLKKVMQLSGIQSGREGQNNIYVRGGSPDQNLLLMDGVPMYETSHVFGLSSVFNEDAIKNVQVFKHAYPAKFGGRLSSVIDFKINEGNLYQRKSSISFSPLSLQLNTEGPIKRGKSSYNLSARTSLINLFYNEPIERLLGFDDSDFSFFDINLKLGHEFSEGNKLYFNLYRGSDDFEISNSESISSATESLDRESFDKLEWDNEIYSLQWHNNVSERVFSKLQVSYSDYKNISRSAFNFDQFDGSVTSETALDIIATSRIIDLGLSADFQVFMNNDWELEFGTSIYHHRYNPTLKQSRVFLDGSLQEFANNAPFISADEITAYVDSKWQLGASTQIKAGLRYNDFYVRDRSHSSLQPRLTVIHEFANAHKLTVSATKMTQFVHLLSNPGNGLPSNLWIPTSDRLPPEHAYQIAAAYGGNLSDNLRFEIAGYYKQIDNVVEYTSPFDLFFTFVNFQDIELKFDANRDFENFVETGDSESRGAEFSLQNIKGPFLFELSYAYSDTDRIFEELNNGNPFPYKYDRTHDFSVTGRYHFSESFNIHANWVYGTGDAFTLADTAIRTIDGSEILTVDPNKGRNSARLSDYHRLDIGMQLIKEMKNQSHLTLGLSVFNAYNRKNDYYVFLFEDTVNDRFELRRVSLFPILPHFSINYEF